MLFHKQKKSSLGEDRSTLIYEGLSIERAEKKDIEKCFARLFSSDDGRKALAYLQHMTFQRALSSSSSEAQLRYLEGQRALMASILRLVDRGRHP